MSADTPPSDDTNTNFYTNMSIVRCSLALLISFVMAKRGYSKNSLDLSGALLAVVVGVIVTLASYSFFACLFTFFVTSSALTKWKSHRKSIVEENFKHGGQRNAVQVFCNGGVSVLISLFYITEVGTTERHVDFNNDFTASILITALIASFACCNGDTWSSEIGTAIGSDSPRLITNFQKVPIGTNGGVTLVGTLASAAGGVVIGVAYVATTYLFSATSLLLHSVPAQWPVIVYATLCGLLGSVVDSYLGATCQYSGFCLLRKKVVSECSTTTKWISGRNFLSNHQVNLLSCVIVTLIGPYCAYNLWPYWIAS